MMTRQLNNKSQPWKLWIDTGGTFTDCIAEDPTGQSHWVKTLSSATLRAEATLNDSGKSLTLSMPWPASEGFLKGFHVRLCEQLDPSQGKHRGDGLDPELFTGMGLDWNAESRELILDREPPVSWGAGTQRIIELFHPDWEAPILAAHLVTQTPGDQSLPALEMRLGSTKGTNALLERKTAKVGLIVNQGLEDHLYIRDQRREDLFALSPKRTKPFYHAVAGISFRRRADGQQEGLLNEEEIIKIARQWKTDGIEAVAVCLMHAYAYPEDEEKIREILEAEGMRFLSTSFECAPFIKWIPRCETVVINASLEPIMKGYLDRIQNLLSEESRLWIMTSSGGLVSRNSFQAKDGLLSGPAGGVVGVASLASQVGREKWIGFDMGGTSADVCRYDGQLDYRFECRVGESRAMAPSLKIETVAAGGGSICRFDGERLRVGPESAGADPGPACYGAGGPLTVTDIQVLLGRLDPARFGIPIRTDLAEAAFEKLRQEIGSARGEVPEREILLQGLLDIANERMAETIRKISVQEGFDPAEYALVAFGGAGGQTVCSLADRLGITSVYSPMEAGLFSARGIRDAAIERMVEAQWTLDLENINPSHLSDELDSLMDRAERLLNTETGQKPASMSAIFEMRYRGQGQTLSVRFQSSISLRQLITPDTLITGFQDQYEEIFGYLPENKTLELVSARVVAASGVESPAPETFEVHKTPGSQHTTDLCQRAFTGRQWEEVPVWQREELHSGDLLEGPCLIADAFNAIWVETNWTALVGSHGTLYLEKSPFQTQPGVDRTSESNLVMRELFASRFRGIAEAMGGALERTAVSTNVKERLDFSCALLDAQGELIVNAPHIPVHLGALGSCVRSICGKMEIRPGDCIVTNHPAHGGSHLPDVTVVTPVYSSARKLLGYVANRAHHAEIGGIRPGSMPPNAQSLAEEGVVIKPTRLFSEGVQQYNVIRNLLEQAPYPSRAVEDNLADLRAQVAANRLGERLLLKIVEEYGEADTLNAMQDLKSVAELALLNRLKKFPAQPGSSRQTLDDGAVIQLQATRKQNRLELDFSGTSTQHSGNLNATPAIVISSTLYVLRCWVNEPIPLNEGALKIVDLIIPSGSMLNPEFGSDDNLNPAVVGGNVETSQRVVDALWQALEMGACSQGTMNNFVFGSKQASHYETIGGGSGAIEGSDGESGIHVHMTNTGITDPEILESRFPLILEKFAIRPGSGGDGRWRGGNGLIRRVRFLEPMSVSLLTQRRRSGPEGAGGGCSGAAGEQYCERANGVRQRLDSMARIEVSAGDCVEIRTPGGGGFGGQVSESMNSNRNDCRK